MVPTDQALSLPEKEAQPASKTQYFFKKLDDERSPKRETYVSDWIAFSSIIGLKFSVSECSGMAH